MIRSRVLIAGVSSRAAAESAARAGFDVTAIDGFADLDQHPAVRTLPPLAPFEALAAARATRDIACDAVVYLSPFENHRRAVATLASGRALWGNAPDVLARARDPVTVADMLRGRGFETLEVRSAGLSGPRSAALKGPPYNSENRPFLLKPLKSGGGRGVRPWPPGTDIPRGTYLQEFVEGTPGSVVFVAADGRAVPLGVLRQLIGEAAFGAAGFRY